MTRRHLLLLGTTVSLLACHDAPTSPEAIRSTIKRFTDAGFDELVFTATTADDTMASLDRLADVASATTMIRIE